jgi:hypothetical protein
MRLMFVNGSVRPFCKSGMAPAVLGLREYTEEQVPMVSASAGIPLFVKWNKCEHFTSIIK